jgi:hypothetical protein
VENDQLRVMRFVGLSFDRSKFQREGVQLLLKRRREGRLASRSQERDRCSCHGYSELRLPCRQDMGTGLLVRPELEFSVLDERVWLNSSLMRLRPGGMEPVELRAGPKQ